MAETAIPVQATCWDKISPVALSGPTLPFARSHAQLKRGSESTTDPVSGIRTEVSVGMEGKTRGMTNSEQGVEAEQESMGGGGFLGRAQGQAPGWLSG